MKDPALLHIYAQSLWHDDAFIIGNREGLELLRDALNEALTAKKSIVEATTTDGEGYHLFSVLNEDAWNAESWVQLVLPYTDRGLYQPPKDRKHPINLLGNAAYLELIAKLRTEEK